MAGTRWVRLDLEYYGNPKAQAAGLHGRAFHTAAICWSAAHLTDGHIPPDAIPRICADAGVRREAITRCVTAGLLVPVDDGWEIHDYLSMQPSRFTIEQRRKKNAERLAKWRADHDM